MKARTRLAGVAVAALAAGLPIATASARHAATAPTQPNTVKHVLLLSVDGLHQSDLNWYVHKYPKSTLAALVSGGAEFTNANTTIPSDSFPGWSRR